MNNYSYTYNSPLGALQIEASNHSLRAIKFLSVKTPAITDNDSIKSDPVIIKMCISQLDEYFNKKRREFTIPLDPQGTAFEKMVWDELLKIPYGQTIPYSNLAKSLGDIKKIRAVGRANGKNPIPIIIPCHRVIGKDGDLVGYGGGLDRKKLLLIHEGALSVQTSIF